jgi:hypothetical protein
VQQGAVELRLLAALDTAARTFDGRSESIVPESAAGVVADVQPVPLARLQVLRIVRGGPVHAVRPVARQSGTRGESRDHVAVARHIVICVRRVVAEFVPPVPPGGRQAPVM